MKKKKKSGRYFSEIHNTSIFVKTTKYKIIKKNYYLITLKKKIHFVLTSINITKYAYFKLFIKSTNYIIQEYTNKI